MNKKVLLILIDACTPRVLEPALERGDLPQMQALLEAGDGRMNGTTIFPSITHAALTSLVTGKSPTEHGILGSHWYRTEEEEVIYYGAAPGVIVNESIGKFFEDFLVKLNQEHLQTPTLFERIEKKKKKAASLNHLVFHGHVKHKVNTPLLLRLLPGVPATETVFGPSMLYLGDFVLHDGTNGDADTIRNENGGALNWFGLKDDSTADLLIQLAQNGALPDFTLAYFGENDVNSHQVGPETAVATLIHLDQRLGEFIDAYGGLEALLADVCVIVTADHSQSAMVDDKEKAAIRLDQILADCHLAQVGQPWQANDELMACPNMRAVQFYFKQFDESSFHNVMARLLADPRVDQVIWPAEITEADQIGFRVATQDRGALHFWPQKGKEESDTANAKTAVDERGQRWQWNGSLHAVSGQVSDDGVLTFPTYPDAFARIAGVIKAPESGQLWATAQPGHEFFLPRSVLHTGGGSHGSLHKDDSLIPLIIAGAPVDLALPTPFRLLDVAPLCLEILGLETA